MNEECPNISSGFEVNNDDDESSVDNGDDSFEKPEMKARKSGKR